MDLQHFLFSYRTFLPCQYLFTDWRLEYIVAPYNCSVTKGWMYFSAPGAAYLQSVPGGARHHWRHLQGPRHLIQHPKNQVGHPMKTVSRAPQYDRSLLYFFYSLCNMYTDRCFWPFSINHIVCIEGTTYIINQKPNRPKLILLVLYPILAKIYLSLKKIFPALLRVEWK
jgi:hypothetical protein